MKLSELIEEFVDSKIEGPPEYREWTSIHINSENERRYHARLQELRDAIDAAMQQERKP